MISHLTDHQKEGLRESIYLSSRWSLALFAAGAVLAGWLGMNFRAGNFDMVFWAGVIFDAGLFIGCGRLIRATRRDISLLRTPT